MKAYETKANYKAWNFDFENIWVGTGTNLAKTKEESIKMAKKKYKGNKHAIIIEESFRVAPKADAQILLSLKKLLITLQTKP